MQAKVKVKEMNGFEWTFVYRNHLDYSKMNEEFCIPYLHLTQNEWRLTITACEFNELISEDWHGSWQIRQLTKNVEMYVCMSVLYTKNNCCRKNITYIQYTWITDTF